MKDFKRVASTAERLKLAMEASGMIQADLSRETGIDKGALSSYLKGKYEPKQDTIYKLANALNVSEMWLWGYDCERERPSRIEKSVTNDGLTEGQRALIETARSFPADKADLALRLLLSIVESD